MLVSGASGVPFAAQRQWAPLDPERPGTTETTASRPFGRTWDSFLPGPVRAAWTAVEGAVNAGVDLLVPDEDVPHGAAQLTRPLDRALEAQRALVDEHAFLGSADRFHGEGLQVWRTEAWPLGQVLHGRVALAMQTGDWARVDAVLREFESYRSDDGFTGGVGIERRYYDDNAWIGLAAMQAHVATGDPKYLQHAERTFRMVQSGQHPEGGLYWYEQDKVGRHTCSVAPAAQLALQLHAATGDERYLRFATEQADWLAANLRMSSGLYADNVRDDGTVGRDVWSYNQGTPIGLDVQLFRATGDRAYLERAQATADAALRFFGAEDRLWRQPASFNVIFLRNLLALHAAAPDPRYVRVVDTYLERVWTEARNPDTGLFDQGDIGHYGDEAGSVLDQGALSQLYAIRALPPGQWSTLT